MKKFEYKTTYVPKISPTLENSNPHTLYNNQALIATMNELGLEGWELVQIMANDNVWTDYLETSVRGFLNSSINIPVVKTSQKGYYLVWKREV